MNNRLTARVSDRLVGTHPALCISIYCVGCDQEIPPDQWNQDTYMCRTCSVAVLRAIRHVVNTVERARGRVALDAYRAAFATIEWHQVAGRTTNGER